MSTSEPHSSPGQDRRPSSGTPQVLLSDRRAPASGRRAPAAGDVCPATGRGRLSYPRAKSLFKQASTALDPHKKGWSLHQLRHSALQHLAADGRTAPELQAKSRHQHLASLGRYVQLGEQTSARITAQADPAARRRAR
jgi:integrase